MGANKYKANEFDLETLSMSQKEVDKIFRASQRRNMRIWLWANFTISATIALKYIIFTPLAIGCRTVSFLASIVGRLLSIGLPFGIWRLVQIIPEILNGAKLDDVGWWPVGAFVFLPFIAFGIDYFFMGAANFFDSIE